jgi:hypothetical protein
MTKISAVLPQINFVVGCVLESLFTCDPFGLPSVLYSSHLFSVHSLLKVMLSHYRPENAHRAIQC